MIKTKKVERLIQAVGGPKKAEIILANVPKSAFFYQPKLGLYARKSVVSTGLLTSVLLGGRWVFWGNPEELIKLSDLRQALAVFQKANVLDIASNDEPETFIPFQVSLQFGIHDHVVYLDLLKIEDVLLVSEIHKHPENGTSYVVKNKYGRRLKVNESDIRKAMIQEELTGKRVNSIEEALTVTEVENLRRHAYA
jgi:hypothetical protein